MTSVWICCTRGGVQVRVTVEPGVAVKVVFLWRPWEHRYRRHIPGPQVERSINTIRMIEMLIRCFVPFSCVVVSPKGNSLRKCVSVCTAAPLHLKSHIVDSRSRHSGLRIYTVYIYINAHVFVYITDLSNFRVIRIVTGHLSSGHMYIRICRTHLIFLNIFEYSCIRIVLLWLTL